MKACSLVILIGLLPILARSQSFFYNRPFLARQARSNTSPPPPPTPSYPSGPYDAPAVYDFAWQVLDSYSGNDYGHQESRNDVKTTGSYHVALPDGRVQRVTYSVDGYGGYTAEVTYEGDAKYPEVQAYPYSAATQVRPSYAPVAAPAPVEAKAVEEEPEAPAAAPVETPVAVEEPVQEAVEIRVAQTPAPTVRRYTYRTRAPEVVTEAAPVVEAEEKVEVVEEAAKAVDANEETTYAPAEAAPASYYYRFY